MDGWLSTDALLLLRLSYVLSVVFQSKIMQEKWRISIGSYLLRSAQKTKNKMEKYGIRDAKTIFFYNENKFNLFAKIRVQILRLKKYVIQIEVDQI